MIALYQNSSRAASKQLPRNLTLSLALVCHHNDPPYLACYYQNYFIAEEDNYIDDEAFKDISDNESLVKSTSHWYAQSQLQSKGGEAKRPRTEEIDFSHVNSKILDEDSPSSGGDKKSVARGAQHRSTAVSAAIRSPPNCPNGVFG
ncbi:hypothetical protein CAPTEDRAFT_209867 [Capitella teleta]|uniref:Uncharacterized protein n=1 Tax=Capitella teleta TaxID=283909 RepID=R7UNU8_CAPTE|nr:hypothetical protein CAPTEDRAFT_209867 [Capitella teleta]|eukprot:ELU07900.1 hypothetical protein CAPTEDRAFT_209867 [Capitella teleta]